MAPPIKNAMSALVKRVSLLFTAPEHRISTSGFDTTRIVFCSPGIPVSEKDLHFGDWMRPDELAALSRFSRLVNSVPNPSDLFTASGNTVWDVYDNAVSYAAFPNVRAAAGTRAALSETLSDESGSGDADQQVKATLEPVYQYFQKRRQGEGQPRASSPEEWISSGLREYLQHLNEEQMAAGLLTAPETEALNPAYSYYHNLKLRLDLGAMRDRMGPYWPTPFVPPDILSGGYRWEQLTIRGDESKTGGLSDDDLSGLEYLTVELIQLPLLRPWWNPTIFRSRGWKWSIPLAPVSDGGMPGQGMMPLYITSVILARNLEVRISTGAAGSERLGSLSGDDDFGLFGLREVSSDLAEGTSTNATDVVTAPDPRILGFICERVPRCPNPDLTLDWPRD